MPEIILAQCELCRFEYPVEGMAFETLETNHCLKIWLCPQCFQEIIDEQARNKKA